MVFASSGFPKATLRAIQAGRQRRRDVDEHRLGAEEGLPHAALAALREAPSLRGDGSRGRECYKAESGEIVWQERLADKTTFSASPVFAAGKIYVLSEAGETIVLAAAPEFKVLSRNPLGEKMPGVAGGVARKALHPIGQESLLHRQVGSSCVPPAVLEDCALLAGLNHQLIRDEGHRVRFSLP